MAALFRALPPHSCPAVFFVFTRKSHPLLLPVCCGCSRFCGWMGVCVSSFACYTRVFTEVLSGMAHTTTLTMTKNKDFLTLYKQGKTIVSPYVILYFRKNRCGQPRLGITAGKKVGNAVCRNRAKRLIRAAYRELEPLLPRNIDLVIVARAPICSVRSTVIADFFTRTAARKIHRCFANSGGAKPS